MIITIIKKLDETFGQEAPLTEAKARLHNPMGITIGYAIKGKVKFSMFDYRKEIMQGLPDNLKGTAVTLAAKHLFKMNEDAKNRTIGTKTYFVT